MWIKGNDSIINLDELFECSKDVEKSCIHLTFRFGHVLHNTTLSYKNKKELNSDYNAIIKQYVFIVKRKLIEVGEVVKINCGCVGRVIGFSIKNGKKLFDIEILINCGSCTIPTLGRNNRYMLDDRDLIRFEE